MKSAHNLSKPTSLHHKTTWMTVVRLESWRQFDKILINNKEQRGPQEIIFYATVYVAIFLSAAIARQMPLCNNTKKTNTYRTTK